LAALQDRDALIDEVVAQGSVGRSTADAPDTDDQVFIDNYRQSKVGDTIYT